MAARGKSSGKPKAGGSKTADKPANPIESAEDSTQVDAEPASIEAGDSGAPVESETESAVVEVISDSDDEGVPPVSARTLILVGIGSSAGGLEALKELIAELPTGLNLSYVIAQHLSPTHTSLLQELLRPETDLGVGDLNDGTVPQPDTIYVTPPNQDVMYVDGKLRLEKPQASVGPKPSVDLFFKSLAENHGENTVGIILSGTGSDGAAGVRAIKAAGGVVLVQDPQIAKYDGMPRAAIQTGCVDLVLPAGKMGDVINGLAVAPVTMRLPVQEDEITGSYARIANAVKRHTGFDLTHYKFATVNRRLIRRMSLSKTSSLDEYAELVKSDREESQQMVKDVLISVTSFFRDDAAFESLRGWLEKLFDARSANEVIRIWVPGCATGEEAYTIAMIMSDIAQERDESPEFLIFATDLDSAAVNFARNGVYPDTSVDRLPSQLLSRYFERNGKSYQVKKFLRQNMVFAVQNVIEDPPFSRMDLITCRNLLIYLTRPIQRRALEIFHYALKPGGLLFLGKSESIELHKELFGDLDKRAKLFRRVDAGQSPYAVPMRSGGGSSSVQSDLHDRSRRRTQDYYSATYRLVNALADAYCPPAVVISDTDEAVHFVGDLKPFLRFPRGPAELKIFDLVHEPIRGEMRALVHRARRENGKQTGNSFEVEISGRPTSFMPTVAPLQVEKSTLIVLSFEPAARPAVPVERRDDGARDSLIIDELERELANTRQHLQTVVEELETSNEELLSQSEELQSANEELQSTNEELQTSNEELQSTNEELLTVNDELQSKSQELASTANNLQSVKESLDFPLLVVDERLHVTHFNHAANAKLPRDDMQPDVSIASIEWNFDLVDILPKIREVLRGGQAVESQIQFEGGRVFQLRVMPAMSTDNSAISGAVLIFADVSERQAAEMALREREAMYRLTFDQSPLGMALLRPSLQFMRVNGALRQMLEYPNEELLSRTVTSLVAEDSNLLQTGLAELLSGKSSTFTAELQLKRAGGGTCWVSSAAVSVPAGEEGGQLIAFQVQDISRNHSQHSNLQREHLRLKLHADLLTLSSAEQDADRLMAEAMEAVFRYYPECRFTLSLAQPGGGFKVAHSRQPPAVASVAGRELPADLFTPQSERLEGAASVPVEANSEVLKKLLGRAVLPQRQDLLMYDGPEVLGVLSMEHKDDEAFSEDEIANLASVAELLALKIRDARSAGRRRVDATALSEQKFRLETALSSIADGIITTDMLGHVDYMNPAAVHLTGHPLDESVGKPLDQVFRLIAAVDDRPLPSPLARALSERKIVDRMDQDCFLLHREGRRSVVQCSAAPFLDGEQRATGGILVFRDVTDQNLLAAELSFRASHDPLTGLINRDEFDRRLKSAVTEAKRGGQEHVVCYIDIDQFKVVNDTCGHSAGDELIRQLAALLKSHLRKSDTLARLGGDEFGVLMSNCDMNRGQAVIEGLLAAVREFRYTWQESKFRPTVSIGVVRVDRSTESVATVLSQVDAACFAAKEQGRDRSYVASGSDDDTIRRHGEMQLVSKIAHALEHDLFLLHCEDVVHLEDQSEVIYREVLLRLNGEDGEPIDVNDIVPAAERYLLMSSIDRWVVRRTLQILADDGSDTLYAMNLSGQTLGEEQSLSFILRQIEESGVDPARLCFEITETAAVTHLSEAVRFMETLSAKGVQFSLDDFGSGLASFAYLKQLPVQFLKIDGSFVRGLPDNNFDKTMVAAIQRIGDEIGLRVIAEHAENETILNALKELGVKYVQGYAVGARGQMEV